LKKCPKCGTILDDSKTKCYMCGENLGIGGSASFLDNVGNEIDSPKEEDIEVLSMEEPQQPQEDVQTFTSHNSTMDYYSSEINQLNLGNNSGTVVDDYNPFAQDASMQSPLMQQQPAPQPIPELPPTNMPAMDMQPVQPLPEKPKKQKKVKQPKTPKEHRPIPKSMIFNSLCFIIFMGLIIFAYFKFIRKPPNENVHLRGLTYTIDPRFELQNNDNEPTTNYYKYGTDCIIRIEYGFTNDSEADSPEKKYLKSVEEEFKNDKNIITGYEELLVKGNKWTTLSVYYIPYENNGELLPSEIEQSKLRFRYLSIFHNGSLYNIQYYNPTTEETCENMFNTFTTTLNLE